MLNHIVKLIMTYESKSCKRKEENMEKNVRYNECK